MANLFSFWADVPGDARVHPLDKPILDRVKHGFDLRCLPACVDGPLRTAPVVLLYLSPGWKPHDVDEADTSEAQARYAERRQGFRPLTGEDENSHHYVWRASRTRLFGPWEAVRTKLAVLNIVAYHSEKFTDEPLLAALPSSRAVLDWAQSTLFPAAERGERVVVCMRSARFWGLDGAPKHGRALYAPPVTRGGHMLQGPLRNEIVGAVKAALASDGLGELAN